MQCAAPLAERPAAPRRARKLVTVLFSDVTGFTPLSERTDSEALHAVMDRYVVAMRKVIERHEGRVERFIGDAVMATFGLPAVREDDALRAVRAAVEIGDALKAVNAEIPRGLSIDLTASTGVNSGEVFVEEDLASGRQVGELVGDAINVAARLGSAAEAGEVMLGELTFQLTRASLQAERLELSLKGKAQKVTAYRLLKLAPTAAPSDRRLKARTVGREREAAQLTGDFERAQTGSRCVLTTLLGLAGEGKSRLIADAARSLRDRARVLSGRCLPYGEATIFWPLAEITCQAAGITRDEQAERAIAAIAKLLAPDPDATQLATASRLAGAFGLGPLAGAAEEIAPDIASLLRALAGEGPLVVVIEDIHWAGQGLLAALEHLAARLDDAPLWLICSARPELLEKRPGWPGDAPVAHTIALRSLGDEDCSALVGELLGGGQAADELAGPLVSVVGGNPLVVEEVLAMLIDDGVLAHDQDGWRLERKIEEIRIPPTIEAILGARLDRLSEREREVIEAAATVGKDFDRAEVRGLCDLEPQELDDSIAALVAKQLIETATGTLNDYRFHHILVRDAAYAATPKRRRADLHERFADLLERSPAGQRGGAYGEIVGEHLERACLLRRELGADEAELGQLAHRAGMLLEDAGRRAHGLSDILAARRIYARGEAVLARDDPLRPLLLTGLAEATFDSGLPHETKAIAGEAEALAERLGSDALRARAALARARADVWCDDRPLEDALVEARKTAAELERIGDDRSVVWAWMTVAAVCFFGARFTEASTAGARAVARAERSVPAELPYCLVGMCRSMVRSPMPAAEAAQRCEDALSRLQPDTVHAAIIENELALVEAMSGSFDAARARFTRAEGVFERYTADLFNYASLQDAGMSELLARDYDRAEQIFRRCRELAESLDDLFPAEAAALHARALARLGQYEEALPEARAAREQSPENDLEAQAWWRIAAALSLLGLGELDEAQTVSREAVALARPTGAPLVLGDALSAHGEVLLARGCGADASSVLEEAIALYEAKGIAPAVTTTRELLTRCAGTPTLR